MDAHKDHAAMRRKLRAAARRRPGALPPALFLTDPERTPDFLAISARLPAGWGVIYRHFGAADRFEVARKLARICRRRGLTLLVSADVQLARMVKADGVHWPEAWARRARRARFAIETTSAHSRSALRRAARNGLNAALLSTVFASASLTASSPIGLQRFLRLAQASPLPLYALGGVGPQTAGQVAAFRRRNLAGWAAVEAIAMAWRDVS